MIVKVLGHEEADCNHWVAARFFTVVGSQGSVEGNSKVRSLVAFISLIGKDGVCVGEGSERKSLNEGGDSTCNVREGKKDKKKKKKEKKVGVSFGHVGVKVEIVVELRQISLIRDVLGGNIGLLLVHVLWLDHDFGLDHRRFDVQDWSFGGNGDRSRSSQDVGMTPKTREVLHHVELPSCTVRAAAGDRVHAREHHAPKKIPDFIDELLRGLITT